MKTSLFFAGTLMLLSLQTMAQHPLVGTWKLVSIKGTNVDGKPFALDTTAVRETKVITPTHYMLIAEDVRGDSLVFNRSYAGTIKFDGNRFHETPFQASIPIYDGVKTDFTWKVEGDIFTQSGSITRPDGKKVILEALTFRRANIAKTNPANPAIGAWSQVSSSFTDFDGTKQSHTKETTSRFQIITPNYWMRISHQNGTFEHAVGGTYELVNGKTILHVVEGLSKVNGHVELTDRVEGDRLYESGSFTKGDGTSMTWDDIFEKVKPM